MPNTSKPKDINFEFIFNIENYKNIEHLNLKLADYNVLIVEGDNETGKTSLVTSIMEAHMGKSITDKPLTEGTDKGFVEHKIKDKNGNPVIVKQSFKKDGKSKFIAINHEGITLSKVSDFEQLFGKYFPITVQDFFNLAKTTPGRKEITDKYLIQLFTPEQKERLKYIDANINDKYGVLYNKRRELNSKISVLESSIKGYEINPEDKELLNREEDALKLHKTLQDELSQVQTRINTINQITFLFDELSTFQTKSLKILGGSDNPYIVQYNNNMNEAGLNLRKYLDSQQPVNITELKDRINKGNLIIDRIKSIKSKVELIENQTKEFNNTKIEQNKTDQELNKLREEKQDIFKNSKLPNGIVITDDGFTIDGFELSDTQLSFSKVGLIFAEIMMNISECNLLVMGNAGEYGTKRLNDLTNLAKRYNKTVILTKIVDDLKEIRVVGFTTDQNAGHEIKHKELSGDVTITVGKPITKNPNDKPKLTNLF